MDKCSVLVLSCDKNLNLLKFFFEMFNENWFDCPFEIFVSLESETFKFGKNIQTLNYTFNKNWSQRIKDCLKQIHTPYVLIILDDFIIEDKVDTKEILALVNRISEDSNIANIILSEINCKTSLNKFLMNKYILHNRYSRYKTSLQLGIWKKDVLFKLLKNKENAWEFEIFSNIRSFVLKEEFYSIINNQNKPIKYNDGFFIVQGKINTNERKRLEKEIKRSINLIDYQETGENLIRDDINLLKRIIRRVKIILYYTYYNIRSKFVI